MFQTELSGYKKHSDQSILSGKWRRRPKTTLWSCERGSLTQKGKFSKTDRKQGCSWEYGAKNGHTLKKWRVHVHWDVRALSTQTGSIKVREMEHQGNNLISTNTQIWMLCRFLTECFTYTWIIQYFTSFASAQRLSIKGRTLQKKKKRTKYFSIPEKPAGNSAMLSDCTLPHFITTNPCPLQPPISP